MEDLYSLLVPLGDARIIVPRSCIAEVISFLPEPATGEEKWMLGPATWNERQIPVVSFETLCGLPAPVSSGRARVVIFRCLGKKLEGGHFGIVTQGFPQLVRVNAAVLETDTSTDWPRDKPVICQLRMINQRPLIPDLEMVEKRIAEALATPA